MAERHRAVVRVVAFDEHMAVEALHFGDGEDADGAEGMRSDGQDLALRHIRAQLAICRRLQAEEGDVARGDVPFQRALRDLFGQRARHDQLVLHLAEAQLFGAGVAAVEAHEGIGELVRILALDIRFIQVLGDGVVDVEKRHRVFRDHGADEFGQGAVDIDLAGDGDAAPRKAGVDVAGHEAELRLEGRPALAGDGDKFARTLVRFDPVEKGQLVLRQLGQNFRLFVAGAQLFGHILDHGGDALVVIVFMEGFKQV